MKSTAEGGAMGVRGCCNASVEYGIINIGDIKNPTTHGVCKHPFCVFMCNSNTHGQPGTSLFGICIVFLSCAVLHVHHRGPRIGLGDGYRYCHINVVKRNVEDTGTQCNQTLSVR